MAGLALGVVAVMVIKPDLTGSGAALAIPTAAGWLSAQWGVRDHPSQTPTPSSEAGRISRYGRAEGV